MIRKSILVLFTLYLGTSVWVFGGSRHTRFGSPTRAHHLNFVPSGHRQLTPRSFHRREQLTRQSFHRRQQLLQHQSFHRRQQLQHQLFHRRESFRHGFILNFQFFRHRPRHVPHGFEVVRVPRQRVKSGRSFRWFAARWTTIKSDKNISPNELVPVWSSGQWSLKWKTD